MNMKALTLALFISCYCLLGMAQERTKDSLMKLFEQTLEKEQDARKNNDYPKAVEGWTHYLEEAAKYPADIQRPMEDAKACYQIGCMYALNNSPKEALKMLEKSIEMGLDDYWNLATDDDMKSLKDNRRYQKLMLKMKAQSDDFSKILKQSAGYTKNTAKDIPAFIYMDANDSNLVRIRNYFNLDSITGTGDEISKIKNLLTWVHNVVRHVPIAKQSVLFHKTKRED